MIVIKNYPLIWYGDYFDLQRCVFGGLTVEFTLDEYRHFTDLVAESKEKPEDLLAAIIEEGLYSFMGGE